MSRPLGAEPQDRRAARAVLGWCLTAGALLLVWATLVLPHRIGSLTPPALLRIPAEGVLAGAVIVALPRRAGRVVAVVLGLVLGVLAVLKTVDISFSAVLDRPFNPIIDLGTFGSAAGVLRDSAGASWAIAAQVGAVLVVLALMVGLVASSVRLARLASRRRRRTARVLVIAGAAWLVCAAAGFSTAGAPVASTDAAVFAYDQPRQIVGTLRDQHAFAQTLSAQDPWSKVPGADLLTGLRGKDVLVVVVESYGRVAVEGSPMSAEVSNALAADQDQLRAAGFDSRSGFLGSPTFGGLSWLAHSTLQSGMWIDSQQRYDLLMTSHRFTLSDAFKRAGWRTVVDIPSNTRDWPEGRSFYHYDKIYDSRNVGYAGPRFSYGTMPDQYTLAAFWRNELAPKRHPPVMAEIDLVSSHGPWAPLPRMVDWHALGDGSIFDPMPAQGQDPSVVLRDSRLARQAYGHSIEYAFAAITSFVRHAHDDNLVLVVYGDHQPAEVVSGAGASHDVPISIIAHDPAVFDQISSWGWRRGLRPDPSGPVWPMDHFRNRFLAAFGPHR